MYGHRHSHRAYVQLASFLLQNRTLPYSTTTRVMCRHVTYSYYLNFPCFFFDVAKSILSFTGTINVYDVVHEGIHANNALLENYTSNQRHRKLFISHTLQVFYIYSSQLLHKSSIMRFSDEQNMVRAGASTEKHDFFFVRKKCNWAQK